MIFIDESFIYDLLPICKIYVSFYLTDKRSRLLVYRFCTYQGTVGKIGSHA